MPTSTTVEFAQAEIEQPDLEALLRLIFAAPAGGDSR
jgi:hypothetical protein